VECPSQQGDPSIDLVLRDVQERRTEELPPARIVGEALAWVARYAVGGEELADLGAVNTIVDLKPEVVGASLIETGHGCDLMPRRADALMLADGTRTTTLG
jgi:hypothetical protein